MQDGATNNMNDLTVPTDTAVSVAPEALMYGSATGADITADEHGAAAVPPMSTGEYLYYLYCEYAKGLLFLAASVLFVLAVPTVLARAGGVVLMFSRFVKRTMDVLGAFVGLILTIPLWIILPILIKLDSRGPVFYAQVRVGLDRRKNQRRFCQKTEITEQRNRDRRRVDYKGSTFKVLKFRTMVSDAERTSGPVWASKNDPRVTRLGMFLRKTRMDEIPQFLNVLIGQMSLVGPRPERPEFVADLSTKVEDYDRRLQIKPGLTGLAQVSSGYDSSISSVVTKVKYDLEYIDNWSIWSDIKIILRTVIVVLTGRGAN